jgi:hypothetical protein
VNGSPIPVFGRWNHTEWFCFIVLLQAAGFVCRSGARKLLALEGTANFFEFNT